MHNIWNPDFRRQTYSGCLIRRSAPFLAATTILLGLMAIPVAGQIVTATPSTGTAPDAVALNPVTNKIYVANASTGDVTVIDGATNRTATVTAGTTPKAIAV